MNTATNLFSIVLLIVSAILAISYCMPEPEAQPDPQNYDNIGIQGQRYGRGRYGLSNYYARRGLNQRLGRGFYSPSIGYYSQYSYLPYYSYYPYYGYQGYGGYGAYGQQGLYNRYGMNNRNRYNNGYNGYGNGGGYGTGDGMSGRYGDNEGNEDQ